MRRQTHCRLYQSLSLQLQGKQTSGRYSRYTLGQLLLDSVMAYFTRGKTPPNSIQPSGYESKTHPSASTANDEEWPIAKLIEASRQLPSRLEKLERLQSYSDENRKLSAEVQGLKQRHAALAERKVSMDQRRTENTLSKNRQSELEAEYTNDFRDGRRVDVIELIEKKLKKRRSQHLSEEDQLKAYRLACYIFELSYECAVKARSGFLSYLSSLLDTLVTDAPCVGLGDGKYKLPDVLPAKRPKDVPQDYTSEVMVLVKEAAGRENLNLEKLVKAVKRELKVKWKENKKKEEILPSFDKSLKKELKGYIEYCTRFSWRAVTQVPPLKIDYNSWTFNPLSHSESQAFPSLAKPNASQRWASTQGGKRIYCYLWPTLYDWENRVIAKGDVVLTGRTSYV